MVIKHERIMTSLDDLLPIMSHDPLITVPYEIQGSFAREGSARKRLSRQRLYVSL